MIERKSILPTLITLLIWWGSAGLPVRAQDSFDASWYNPAAPYVKVKVAQDGVYSLKGSDLSTAG